MDNAIQMNDAFTVATFEPDADGFERIARDGFRSVVSLQTEREDQKVTPGDERALAEAAGLAFHHQDVSGDSLTDTVVDRFRAAVEALPKPVLLHCASGKRSGALTLMHVTSEQGLSGDDAVAAGEGMGFDCGSGALEHFVKSYVDRHRAA